MTEKPVYEWSFWGHLILHGSYLGLLLVNVLLLQHALQLPDGIPHKRENVTLYSYSLIFTSLYALISGVMLKDFKPCCRTLNFL